ncbi:hypothetical protein XF30_03600 [Bradyrhizobium sp. SUTN9-2]|nr:hypothetical protein XF30_03600 [Bradyrhizobium sp. SUTN9-2]
MYRESEGDGRASNLVIARSPCNDAIQTVLRREILDCFAALAMTEYDAVAPHSTGSSGNG